MNKHSYTLKLSWPDPINNFILTKACVVVSTRWTIHPIKMELISIQC